VAKDDTDIVSALRTALAGRVGKQRFELWFGTRTRLELTEQVLAIHVPSQFFLNWIRANFSSQLEAACTDVLGRCPKLEFYVAAVPESDAPVPASAEPSDTSRASSKPVAAAIRVAPSVTEKEPSNEPSRRKFADLESFVAGPSNRLAFASAEMVAQRPGELTPLVLWGPTGVGKTHLLEAIWTATRKSRRRATAIYLSAEQFLSGFLQALRGSGLPSFRRKYRGVDVLLIDDLQVFRGKQCTQIELQYTIDTLLRERRQVVLASDRPPSEMSELGRELIARLESGVVCRIDAPELETRRGIVGQMARRMGMSLPADVENYVASRLTRHAREISGALCQLHATSLAWQRPVDLAMAEEALSDVVRASARLVGLTDIEKAVCHTFGLTAESLQSGRKAKDVSHPRMLAMWLARKHTRAALSEIGHYFGGRSHSTVVSAQKKVDGWLAEGTTLRLCDQPLSIGEAIRQVEQILQAG
jgi:chromosomal replication initiator protein